MCDELESLGAYARGKPEAPEEALVKASTGAARPAFRGSDEGGNSGGDEFGEFTTMPFEGDLVRGDLCAFVSSSVQVIGETDATVRSVLAFMPGMRIAIAVVEKDFHLFHR